MVAGMVGIIIGSTTLVDSQIQYLLQTLDIHVCMYVCMYAWMCVYIYIYLLPLGWLVLKHDICHIPPLEKTSASYHALFPIPISVFFRHRCTAWCRQLTPKHTVQLGPSARK